MNEWELTDEEIGQIERDCYIGGQIERAIATAAQKKLVEWLIEHNEWRDLIKFEVNDGTTKEEFPLLSLSGEEWHSLKAALGVK